MKVRNLDLPATAPHTPLKVYCDAAHNHETGVSSAGFAIKNHNERLIEYTGCQLGKGFESQQAEVEAIERAISILEHYTQVNHVKIYSDCKPALDSLVSDDYAHHFDYLTLEWVPREENKGADLVSQYVMTNYALHNQKR